MYSVVLHMSPDSTILAESVDETEAKTILERTAKDLQSRGMYVDTCPYCRHGFSVSKRDYDTLKMLGCLFYESIAENGE